MSQDLDNYITGHYGEDQFRDEEDEVAKVGLAEEIGMLDQLRTTLRACKEQARLIADSVDDHRTQIELSGLWIETDIKSVDLLYYIAKERGGPSTVPQVVELREDLGRS
jgi:hypothetical protein